jgi:hypothetical protein
MGLFQKEPFLLYTIREDGEGCCNVYVNVEVVSSEFPPLVTGLQKGSTIEARPRG